MDNQSREKRKRHKISDSTTSQYTSYNDSLRKALGSHVPKDCVRLSGARAKNIRFCPSWDSTDI